jgi:hypothetical protein
VPGRRHEEGLYSLYSFALFLESEYQATFISASIVRPLCG